jgi:hypothetical protein
MARDLIPPASPAGRPTTPGGTPNLIELPPEPPRSGAQPAAQAVDLPPSEYRNRFGFLMGALAGVVLAVGIVVAIAVTSQGPAADEGFAAHWSVWQPPQTDVTPGAQEIADHVGAEYKQDNGSQLTMVKGEPMPGVQIAVRPTSGPIKTITPSHGVIYTLNGLGADGALTGKSSLARGQLLRREALELALYTFRYLPDVDSVLALLPTIPAGAQTKGGPTTEPQSQAVFYRPGDLKQQLQTPLRFTMAPKSLGPAGIGAGDGRRVDALTLSNLFLWSLQHAQTGETYLVLDHARTG